MNRSLLLAASLFIVLLAGVLVIACSDDEDEPGQPAPPQSATATATTEPEASPPSITPPASTPTPDSGGATDCPLAGEVCDLADELDAAIQANDYEAIVGLVQPRQQTCPGGTPQGAGGPFPLCEGAPAGETRTGYLVAYRYSEGTVVDAEGLATLFRNLAQSADASASDEYGDGALRLVAISCAEGDAEDCSRATIVFTALVDAGPQVNRQVLVFWLDLPVADAGQPIDSVWAGILLPDEVPVVMQGEGTLFDLGQVYVLE